MRWILILAMLAGCGGGPSIIAAPRLETYSPAYQNRLADEMEANPLAPCDRIDPSADCSAWKRAVIDYIDTRERIRAGSE